MPKVKRLFLILMLAGIVCIPHTTLARYAALLVDAETGDVLYELDANQAWYPASLTKLMTLYMTFSALESGRLRLSDHMSISGNAARQPTSRLGLKPWDTITVEDAILAIVTRSANDAAVVIAERLAGSERLFAIQMTSTAQKIGMYGSHFMNATGLPHDWQSTTAHDMALLAWKIIHDYPQFYPYFAVESLYYNGRFLPSTNKFIASYPGAEGMKTGYTCGSGYNLVATANLSGKRLIGVILGGMTSYERYQRMFTLMDIGYANEDATDLDKNITTMTERTMGTPPYQLSCGNRPSPIYSARFDEDDKDTATVPYVRKLPRAESLSDRTKKLDPARTLTKIRIASRIKSAKQTAQLNRKNGKHTRVSNKGYFVPAELRKVAMLSNKHRKGYYSPKTKKK